MMKVLAMYVQRTRDKDNERDGRGCYGIVGRGGGEVSPVLIDGTSTKSTAE